MQWPSICSGPDTPMAWGFCLPGAARQAPVQPQLAEGPGGHEAHQQGWAPGPKDAPCSAAAHLLGAEGRGGQEARQQGGGRHVELHQRGLQRRRRAHRGRRRRHMRRARAQQRRRPALRPPCTTTDGPSAATRRIAQPPGCMHRASSGAPRYQHQDMHVICCAATIAPGVPYSADGGRRSSSSAAQASKAARPRTAPPRERRYTHVASTGNAAL